MEDKMNMTFEQVQHNILKDLPFPMDADQLKDINGKELRAYTSKIMAGYSQLDEDEKGIRREQIKIADKELYTRLDYYDSTRARRESIWKEDFLE